MLQRNIQLLQQLLNGFGLNVNSGFAGTIAFHSGTDFVGFNDIALIHFVKREALIRDDIDQTLLV